MIAVDSLTMFYGTTKAVDGVSFEVQEREIVGLLGPNGAGKTTIMRILTSFIYPSGGTARVAQFDITENPIAARRIIGYLPENPPLYMEMRVDEFIRFIGRARGLKRAKLKERTQWVVEKCGISSVWKHTIHELSLGFRQRVGLAQALIHDPRVIILDEPTSGLDPIQIIGVRNLIKDLAKDKTILFSTHILQEASAISNRLLIINGGRIVAQGTPEELAMKTAGESCTVGFQADRQEAESALKGIPSVQNIRFVGDRFGAETFSFTTSAYQEAAVAINQLVREKSWVLKELSHGQMSLEDVFVRIFEKSS